MRRFMWIVFVLSLFMSFAPQTAAAKTNPATYCANSYFPLRTGASWNYTSTVGQQHSDSSRAVTAVVPQTESARAYQTITTAGGAVPFTTTCTANGLLQPAPSDITFSGPDGGSGTFQVTSQSGVLLPPADQVVPGATWRESYQLATTATSQGRSISGSATVTIDSSAIGVEQVVVPAGTFAAIKIEQHVTITQRYTTATRSTRTITTSGARAWYLVAGVGPVKRMPLPDQPLPGDAVVELTSYTQP